MEWIFFLRNASHSSKQLTIIYVPDDNHGTTFVELTKKDSNGLGLVITGGIDKDKRATISHLRPGGVAQRYGNIKCYIGLFKMFSRWILGIFNVQIQSERGNKFM